MAMFDCLDCHTPGLSGALLAITPSYLGIVLEDRRLRWVVMARKRKGRKNSGSPCPPGTATAANNLVRCMFAAASTASAAPLVDIFGTRWAYTAAAFVAAGMSSLLWALIFWGPSWRRGQRLRQEVEALLTKATDDADEPEIIEMR